MHDAFDEYVALPFERRVMLWSIRVWVTGIHHEIGAAERIREAMERLGAEAAAPYLDGFMIALGGGAKRRIAIHCCCHARVEADERLLLEVLTLSQAGRALEALLLLRGLVHDEAAAPTLRSAQCLGTELALAGHFLTHAASATVH